MAPCGPQRLSPPAGEAWLAVGDAACAFDPITGGGLTRALRSAIAAGDAIARTLLGGEADALAALAADQTAAALAVHQEMARVYRSARSDRDTAFWRLMRSSPWGDLRAAPQGPGLTPATGANLAQLQVRPS